MRVTPAQVAAAISVDAAVSSALAATPRSQIALPVNYYGTKLTKLVAYLAHKHYRAGRSTPR